MYFEVCDPCAEAFQQFAQTMKAAPTEVPDVG